MKKIKGFKKINPTRPFLSDLPKFKRSKRHIHIYSVGEDRDIHIDHIQYRDKNGKIVKDFKGHKSGRVLRTELIMWRYVRDKETNQLVKEKFVSKKYYVDYKKRKKPVDMKVFEKQIRKELARKSRHKQVNVKIVDGSLEITYHYKSRRRRKNED